MVKKDQPNMEALAELVQQRRAALGKTLRAIANESGLSLAFVHKVASGQLASFPTPRTAEGLARALEVPLQSVHDAAGRDIGIKEFVISDEGNRRAIYYGTEGLSERDLKFVLDMVNRLSGTAAGNQDVSEPG